MAERAENRRDKSSGTERPICGIVRPIAEMGEYSSAHWLEVHGILTDALDSAGYRARLVSESDVASVILSDIVTNLYNDPIVICDVSGRNPNVMFELGMRLAFEKPTVIVTDDTTPFTFDISPVKHLIYPKSLRFSAIMEFKEILAGAVAATAEAYGLPDHKGYLQQFGPIKVTQLSVQQVELQSLARDVSDIRRELQALTALSVDFGSRGNWNVPLPSDAILEARSTGRFRFIVPTTMVSAIRENLNASRVVSALAATESPTDSNRTFLEVRLRPEFVNAMFDARSEVEYLVRNGAGILRDGVSAY